MNVFTLNILIATAQAYHTTEGTTSLGNQSSKDETGERSDRVLIKSRYHSRFRLMKTLVNFILWAIFVTSARLDYIGAMFVKIHTNPCATWDSNFVPPPSIDSNPWSYPLDHGDEVKYNFFFLSVLTQEIRKDYKLSTTFLFDYKLQNLWKHIF